MSLIHRIRNTFKLSIDYLIYRFTAYSHRGYGIHSPLVFDFTQSVLCRNYRDEPIVRVETLRKKLIGSKNPTTSRGCGENSSTGKTYLSVGELARYSSAPCRLGRFLYGTAQWCEAQTILEIGTSIGVGALYLGLANSNSRVITLEGEPDRAELARRNFLELGVSNVELIEGSFDHTLTTALTTLSKVDMLFMDGNHRGDATIESFNACFDYLHPRSVVVIDDIRWSSDMQRAWQQLRDDPRVSVSIDMFRAGILLFRQRKPKQHFAIKYWLY